MADVDDYLDSIDDASRAAFARILTIAMELSPAAEQSRSYGMAALRHRGRPLLGFKAAKGHLSIFPFSPAAVDAARSMLDGFAVSKGTVRFTADKPLPNDAVREIVRFRIAEIESP